MVHEISRFADFYGDSLKVECPTGSGSELSLDQFAEELTQRLINIFRCDEQIGRPFYGTNSKLRDDPHFRGHILFYEYFHDDSGRGMGVSHQTGWIALMANLLQPLG